MITYIPRDENFTSLLSIYLLTNILLIYMYVCLWISQSVSQSIRLSVHPSVCISFKSNGTHRIILPTCPFYGKSWKDKISSIQNNTKPSKLVLVTDITFTHKLGTVISVTNTCLNSFVLFSIYEILPPLTSLKRLIK